MKILLAADGSPYTLAAARHLADHVSWFAKPPEVHVLHVRAPLPYPGARGAAGKSAVEKYQKEESESALAVAIKELERRKVPFRTSWCVGDTAQEIAAYAKLHGIDMVVMGSHGHGALANLALGSVATKCIATLDVPVLIVRNASGKRRAPR